MVNNHTCFEHSFLNSWEHLAVVKGIFLKCAMTQLIKKQSSRRKRLVFAKRLGTQDLHVCVKPDRQVHLFCFIKLRAKHCYCYCLNNQVSCFVYARYIKDLDRFSRPPVQLEVHLAVQSVPVDDTNNWSDSGVGAL